jgi:thioredoxin-related protein
LLNKLYLGNLEGTPKDIHAMKCFSFAVALAFAFAISVRAAAPPGWTNNYAKAVETAKAENKNLLLDFTGSDWCGYCKLLDKQVFSTPQFKEWAKNYVLVQVDFPHAPLAAHLKAQNDDLKAKYPVTGYPTIVIMDASGAVLARKVGYQPGSGPAAYIDELDAALKK